MTLKRHNDHEPGNPGKSCADAGIILYFAYIYFYKGDELALPIIPEAQQHAQSLDSYSTWLVSFTNEINYYPGSKQNALNLWSVALSLFHHFEQGRRRT